MSLDIVKCPLEAKTFHWKLLFGWTKYTTYKSNLALNKWKNVKKWRGGASEIESHLAIIKIKQNNPWELHQPTPDKEAGAGLFHRQNHGPNSDSTAQCRAGMEMQACYDFMRNFSPHRWKDFF